MNARSNKTYWTDHTMNSVKSYNVSGAPLCSQRVVTTKPFLMLFQVPRWREMIFTSLASAEGIENTDDEVYRKRHQKLEAEERRQLR